MGAVTEVQCTGLQLIRKVSLSQGQEVRVFSPLMTVIINIVFLRGQGDTREE